MKTCPKCKELVVDSANDCFNCRYSFVFNRIITQEELRNKRLEEELRISKKAEIENEELRKIEELKLKAINSQTNLRNMRYITTGYNFEGFKISTYLGLISGESVLGTGFISEYKAALSDTFGIESTAFSNKLLTAKKSAINTLIESCIEIGGNAIIGIKFDYITFTNNLIGVVVDGTAVIIERE